MSGAAQTPTNSDQVLEGGGTLPNGNVITPSGATVNPQTGQTITPAPTYTNTNITYTPLEPIPGLTNVQTGTVSFGALLSALFKILIIIGALIAVGSFVYAGIAYMISDVIDKKKEAINRLQAAVWGLMLLIGSWVILYTINPQLVIFSNVVNPVNGVQPAPTTQQTTSPQQDASTCVGSGGTPNYPTGSNGSAENCAQSQSLWDLGTCSNMPSGGICIVPPAPGTILPGAYPGAM